ncbi:MAG: YicC family protein [Clostridia bacterium]|nr:YicC family protein [Clostridia bacterium]
MIKSMTAFGRAKREGERADITVELRSVNSRFFDCSVRLPRAYAFLEETVKSYVQKTAISRAKVDVYITVQEHESAGGHITPDLTYAAEYIAALRTLRDAFALPDDITTMNVARHAEVFTVVKEDTVGEEAWDALRPVLDEALAGYRSMREAEGNKIRDDLFGKLALVQSFVDEVETISKTDTVGYRDKLQARLSAILGDAGVAVDENRLLTECAIWADKIAIDEELVRLRSHFGAFSEIASLPEPSGRKLDFLMQEMNRETNTIGSKANNARIARIVVNIKGELEKMREQIQNIE